MPATFMAGARYYQEFAPGEPILAIRDAVLLARPLTDETFRLE